VNFYTPFHLLLLTIPILNIAKSLSLFLSTMLSVSTWLVMWFFRMISNLYTKEGTINPSPLSTHSLYFSRSHEESLGMSRDAFHQARRFTRWCCCLRLYESGRAKSLLEHRFQRRPSIAFFRGFLGDRKWHEWRKAIRLVIWSSKQQMITAFDWSVETILVVLGRRWDSSIQEWHFCWYFGGIF